MKLKTILLTITAVCFASGLLFAAGMSESDRTYLAKYEKVHAALVADDLAAAKAAAKELGEEGDALAQSASLDAARNSFPKLSDKAKKLAKGQPGFYVVHCPMAAKDWVQTSKKIANPYYGQKMSSCGEIRN